MTQLALKLGNYQIDEDLGFTGHSLNQAGQTPAQIISGLIPTIFIIAGLILLAMVVSGGFTIFTSAGNPEKIKKGQGAITNALIGFLLIFAAYWIIQLLEFTFGFQVI